MEVIDTNSDSDVRDGKDEELNSDDNSVSNGVLGRSNKEALPWCFLH